jgi:hypothetical protein
MATVHLGRSEKEFWAMTPRKLRSMISEWLKMEKYRSKVFGITIASYMNGKDPDEFLEVKPQKRIVRLSRDALERNARLVF